MPGTPGSRQASHRALHPGPECVRQRRPGVDPLWWRRAITSTARQTHRPGRCRRHRAQLPGPAGHPAPARPGAVLRLPGPQQAAALDPGRAARRPLPRTPDRHDRRGGAARPELAAHHRRPHRRRGRRCRTPESSGPQHRRHPGPRRRQRERHRPGLLGRRRGAAVPGAHLHRHGHPAQPPPAGSSASPRCAWSARRPGRSRWSPRSRQVRQPLWVRPSASSCSSCRAANSPRSRSPARRSSPATCR